MITILCPSRGRPDKFKAFLDTVKETSDGGVEVLLYLDDDDKTLLNYPEDPILTIYIDTPRYLGPAYQYLYERSDGDIVMMGADDIRFRQQGWADKVVASATQDNIFLSSFDDGGRPKKENGHPFMGRGFVDAIGFLTHKDIAHACVDNWVVDIARGIDRFYYLDLGIEHVHPKYKKGQWDDTYKRRSVNDGPTFESLEPVKKKIIKRIKGAL